MANVEEKMSSTSKCSTKDLKLKLSSDYWQCSVYLHKTTFKSKKSMKVKSKNGVIPNS